MPVEINFTANLSEVRAQLDRLIADARSKTVTVPIAGSGGGFSGAGVGGFSASPTIAGVFGTSYGAAAGGFGAGIGPLIGPSAGPLALAGFTGQGFAGSLGGGGGQPPTVAGTLGFPATLNPLALAGGGGGGAAINIPGNYGGGIGGGGFAGSGVAGRNSFSGGFAGRGFGRIVGAGFLANETLRVAEAGREYSMASILAGDDQRSQLDATLAYRRSIIGSTPLVGRGVELLEDPTGAREAGITATLRGADANDAKTRLLKENSTASERIRNAASLAGVDDPLQHRLEAARIDNLDRRRAITERGYDLAAKDREIVSARQAQLEADRSGEANRIAVLDKSQGYTAAYESAMATLKVRDDASVATLKDQQSEALKRTLAPDYANEELRYNRVTENDRRQDDYRRQILRTSLVSDIRESASLARNDSRSQQ
jgi:hypothetical protein